MSWRDVKPIDCDVHVVVPHTGVLLPYLDDYWRDYVTVRGVRNLDMTSYPPTAPLTSRPDWRPETGHAGTDLALLRRHVFDELGAQIAICNVIWGAQALHHHHLAAALCRAVNSWLAAEWLDQEPRLRASIVVPWQNAAHAVEEIERCAADKRFVQVLLLAMADQPLGREHYWPIYEAAVRHGLPVAIHAGSAYRHAPTSLGWPSTLLEDYVGQASAFQNQLMSLICEGALAKFPNLKVVLVESGVTWLPAFMWRANKIWRAMRMETPWVDRPPAAILRDQVRLTLQPFDAPPDAALVEQVIEQIDSDRTILFATDYPHWQFDEDEVIPPGLSADLARRVLVDNALGTYPRLESLS